MPVYRETGCALGVPRPPSLTPCQDACPFHTILGLKHATELQVSRTRTFMRSQVVLVDGPWAFLLVLTAAEP